MIYTTQAVFRELVQATSYVGEIGSLAVNKKEEGLYLLAATLLDQEVRFATAGLAPKELDRISSLRGQAVSIEEADYLFLQLPLTDACYQQLAKVKLGDLIDPQKSATLCIACETLFGNQEVTMTGPGILGEKQVLLAEELLPFLGLRKLLNSEYPLGIDLFFCDQAGNLLALPRTTQTKEETVCPM